MSASTALVTMPLISGLINRGSNLWGGVGNGPLKLFDVGDRLEHPVDRRFDVSRYNDADHRAYASRAPRNSSPRLDFLGPTPPLRSRLRYAQTNRQRYARTPPGQS